MGVFPKWPQEVRLAQQYRGFYFHRLSIVIFISYREVLISLCGLLLLLTVVHLTDSCNIFISHYNYLYFHNFSSFGGKAGGIWCKNIISHNCYNLRYAQMHLLLSLHL